MSKKQTLVEWHTPPERRATADVLPLRGLAPRSDSLTDYDCANMKLYTWLLIAEEDGYSVEELASDVLRFDLAVNRAWAFRVTLSHLQRARWVHDRIFPTLD
jgi:hypothetical protein